MPKLSNWCDEAATTHWVVESLEMPEWPQAAGRLVQTGRPVHRQVIRALVLTLLIIPVVATLSADAAPVVAPINDQDAISGCSWRAWISPSSSSRGNSSVIFLADRDDSKAIMNIDGSDVFLKVEGKSGPLPKAGDVLERRYSAPGIEVKASYKVTSDCSESASESCEVSGFSVTLEVTKDGRTQIIQAKGDVGC